MKFTKEEISLCKQVAEKYRKDISDGDWIYHEPHNNYFLVIQYVIFQYQLQTKKWFDEQNEEHKKLNIPLWTIFDCLEFLRERAFYLEGLCQTDECEFECDISEMDDMGLVRHTKRHFEGKTSLEACLKAVLAVLKENR